MRREGWWALILLGIGGLAAANHVVASYWDFPAAAGELPDAVRAYRAAGLPWTAADIAPPPVPESENAANDLRAAIAALPKGKGLSELKDHRLYGEPIGSLAPFKAALRLAHLAAHKSKLSFERDWTIGADLTFPEEGGVVSLCQVLVARAEIGAKANDDASALSDLDDARRLTVLIGSEPIIISSLVGKKCDNLALSGTQGCLTAVYSDPVRLGRYQAWLATPTPLPDLVRAFRGEIYATVTNARNFDRKGVGSGLLPGADMSPFGDTWDDIRGDYRNDPKPLSTRREGLPQNTRSRAYMARCLQMWTELAARTHNLSDPIERIGRSADAIGERYENVKGMSHMFDAILFPVFSQFWKTNRETEANRAVTLAFADALILHARTGHWPAALTTPDPLGRGPLKVRFDGGRFRVWSVGRNGKDENGLFLQEKKEGAPRPDDIVAAYPSVPPLPRTSPASTYPPVPRTDSASTYEGE